ncbi:MAG: molecular chaperone HtpG [Deferribacteraceae bacterium]|jgi:molecular chaperone HtpG|nr:molecular chaperone HtpG [Deferribacteraceae bacterium]
MSIEEKSFQTEVSELLDIMIHSLYSNKEIFLRELISNASDAIDKAKYEGLTNPAIYDGGTDWAIRVSFDKDAKTLTVSDNGIGLNREEAVSLLGTIANSGTKEFIKKLSEAGKTDFNNLIGQFGVGFYSSFMVAESVTVLSLKRGENTAVKWKSNGKSTFTVEDADKTGAGTDVTLKLRDGETDILNEWALKRIITTYSDYIEHPIKMNVSVPKKDADGKVTDEYEQKEEVTNSMKALWLKDKAEVTKDELEQFYKHISHDFMPASKVVQFKAEGISEFHALLFIPSHAPFDMFHKDMKYGPTLYVKRVQIMEHCEELLPQYLRFVTGVVESSDLPLNISREILQNNKQIPVMQKNIVRKVLDALNDLKRDDPGGYKKFYGEFGKCLKEGLYFDTERKETIAKLLLLESTATAPGEYTTLEEYVSRMKNEQTDIYFITGSSRKELESSPYLETLKEKDYEALFLTDEFDDIVFSSLYKFEEKPLKSVLKGDLNFAGEVEEEKKESYKTLLNVVKEALGDKVESVRLTKRLKNSPVCLVGGEGAPDANMERLLKAMGQPVPVHKRTLELNPDHPLVVTLKNIADSGEGKDKISLYADIIYSMAILLEGGRVEDTGNFVNKVADIMAESPSL